MSSTCDVTGCGAPRWVHTEDATGLVSGYDDYYDARRRRCEAHAKTLCHAGQCEATNAVTAGLDGWYRRDAYRCPSCWTYGVAVVHRTVR